MTKGSDGTMSRWTGRLLVTCATAAWAGSPFLSFADEPAAATQPKPAEDPHEVHRREVMKQLVPGLERELQGIFHSHLELIRGICGDLPAETRRAIVQTGERAVKDAAVELAELQTRRMLGRQQAGNAPSTGDPVERLATALEKTLVDRVGVAQAENFAAEIAARRERRKKATIALCVAMLDGQMSLTAAKREAIGQCLLEGWHDDMFGTLNTTYARQYLPDGRLAFPGVPNACLFHHLDANQRKTFAFGAPMKGNVNLTFEHHTRRHFPTPLPRDPWWYP